MLYRHDFNGLCLYLEKRELEGVPCQLSIGESLNDHARNVGVEIARWRV